MTHSAHPTTQILWNSPHPILVPAFISFPTIFTDPQTCNSQSLLSSNFSVSATVAPRLSTASTTRNGPSFKSSFSYQSNSSFLVQNPYQSFLYRVLSFSHNSCLSPVPSPSSSHKFPNWSCNFDPNSGENLAIKVSKFIRSQNGQVLLWGVFFGLLITGNLKYVFDSFLFLFFLALVLPAVGVIVFRYWLSFNLIKGDCPNCGYEVTGIKGQAFQCQSCGQQVKFDKENGQFELNDPQNATVDVKARSVKDDDE